MSPPSMYEAALPACFARTTSPGDALAIRRARTQAQAILAHGSKSFALAGLLLGAEIRQDAAVLYAWCRLADDRVDLVPGANRVKAVADLRRELDAIYDGQVHEPLLIAMRALVVRTRLPRAYLNALLDGFAMDAEGMRYASMAALELYAYRVAGVVGLMMCHVMGVRDGRCVVRAAHLGMAMQLTNICRDVAEDWQAGRQYLPLDQVGPDDLRAASVPSAAARVAIARSVSAILDRADAYYASGMRGLRDLGWRNALAIGAAARIYRAIGRRIARRRFDAFAGRAVVSLPAKLGLVLVSMLSLLLDLPRRWRAGRHELQLPQTMVRYDDVQGTV